MLFRFLGLAALATTFAMAADTGQGRLYHVVFLKRNPARATLSKEESARIQAAHMANIQAMADRGVLVAAGPFADNPSVIAGVFFFTTPTAAEARQVAEADPTVVEHRNTVDVLTWRGPAGVGEEYKRLHKEKPETPEDMGVHPLVILRSAGGEMDAGVRARHSEYWARLRASGKVVAAGAVEGDTSAVGMMIFDRIPDAEAASLAAADPAVSAGMLTVEAHRWWSAAHIFPR
jgi:uncharacterized protein YciI